VTVLEAPSRIAIWSSGSAMTLTNSAFRLDHKGIAFTVRPSDQSGFYLYQFRIAGRDIQGKVETRLPGMAVRRARQAIDRKLRAQAAS